MSIAAAFALLAGSKYLPAQTPAAHYQRTQIQLGNPAIPAGSPIAVDGQGNVYLVQGTNVWKVPVTDQQCQMGTCTPVANIGSTVPLGLAVDSNGTLYISSTNNHYTSGQVQKVPPTDPNCIHSCTPVGGGWIVPWSVAVDKNNDVYVTDQLRELVLKEHMATGGGYSPTPVDSGRNPTLSEPRGVAVGNDERVYISDAGIDRIIVETPPAVAGQKYNYSLLNLGTIYPQRVAVDLKNNIYFSDNDYNLVSMATPTGDGYTKSTAINIGLPFSGVAVDTNQNLYVTELLAPSQALEFGAAVINFGNLTEKTQSQPLAASFVFDEQSTVGSTFVTTDGSTPALTPLGQDFFLTSVSVTPHLGAILPCKAGTTYQIGEVCTVAVEFQPFAATSYTGTLGLKNPAGQLIASVSLVGTGLLPAASQTLVCVTKDACGDVVAHNPIFGGGEYGVVSKQNATGGMCVQGKVLPAATNVCTPGTGPVKGVLMK